MRVSVNGAAGPVPVYWRNRGNQVGRGAVRPDCGANVQIRVSGNAKLGRYDIVIVDCRDAEASERVHTVDQEGAAPAVRIGPDHTLSTGTAAVVASDHPE